MEELTTIQSKIYEIRGQRVMLDFDLAALYQVTTSALNQAVKRNIERFPEEFMFRISEIEWKNMSSQFVTTSRVKRPKTSLPYAFTEQGVAMLSAVLRSGMAIQVSISIMKAFVAMRNYITTATTVTSELAEIRAKLALLERADEDNAEAVNDLSEDMRRSLTTSTRPSQPCRSKFQRPANSPGPSVLSNQSKKSHDPKASDTTF